VSAVAYSCCLFFDDATTELPGECPRQNTVPPGCLPSCLRWLMLRNRDTPRDLQAVRAAVPRGRTGTRGHTILSWRQRCASRR